MRHVGALALVVGALEVVLVGGEELQEAAHEQHTLEQLQVHRMKGIEDGVERHSARRHEYDEQAHVGHEVVLDHELHAHEHRPQLVADGQEDEERAIEEVEQVEAEDGLGDEDAVVAGVGAHQLDVVPRAHNAHHEERDEERDHERYFDERPGHGQLRAGQEVLIGDARVLDGNGCRPQPQRRVEQQVAAARPQRHHREQQQVAHVRPEVHPELGVRRVPHHVDLLVERRRHVLLAPHVVVVATTSRQSPAPAASARLSIVCFALFGLTRRLLLLRWLSGVGREEKVATVAGGGGGHVEELRDLAVVLDLDELLVELGFGVLGLELLFVLLVRVVHDHHGGGGARRADQQLVVLVVIANAVALGAVLLLLIKRGGRRFTLRCLVDVFVVAFRFVFVTFVFVVALGCALGALGGDVDLFDGKHYPVVHGKDEERREYDLDPRGHVERKALALADLDRAEQSLGQYLLTASRPRLRKLD